MCVLDWKTPRIIYFHFLSFTRDFYFEKHNRIREVIPSQRRSGTSGAQERCHILMMEAGCRAVGGYRSMRFSSGCPVVSEKMLQPPAGAVKVTDAQPNLEIGHAWKVTPGFNFTRFTASATNQPWSVLVEFENSACQNTKTSQRRYHYIGYYNVYKV